MSEDDAHSSAGMQSVLPAKKEKTHYIIQKVVQALDILEQFHDEVDELGLTELSKRLSLNQSSVAMLLATLKSRNYLEQNNSSGNYRLGFKNLELAQNVLRKIDLYRVAHPVLASISAECGEIAAIAVLSKSHVVELDAIQSDHPVQVMSRVGVHLPVHCTAAGKMLIALQTPRQSEELLQGMELESYTRNTVTCADALKLKLGEIAERGYAIDDEELDREVRGVAAAIRDYAGLVVGAVVITAPSCRVSLERLGGEMADLVQEGARQISARLGFHEAEQKRSCGLHGREGEPAKPKKSRTRTTGRKLKEADRAA